MLRAFLLQQGVISVSSLHTLQNSTREAHGSASLHFNDRQLGIHTPAGLWLPRSRRLKRWPLHNPLQFSKRGSRAWTDTPAPSQNGDEELDDEELDALFEEHGEVVVADPNPRPASAEVDDDAKSLALAIALAEAANDTKAVDILVLHVKPLVYWTRFFVIATAFSRPQLAAIAKKIRDVGSQRFKMHPTGDSKLTSWTLLDYGDVVVHVFLPKERAYYNLEEFYGNAPVVELSFNASDKVQSME
ncbi:hypothetical protein KP509_20G007700 [Ceratopteris richardii]|uniref:Protein Iojap, chloroplastic n=1 Tax=Ceratopteris richardii TaxID=49495 RepID=A0A8T2SEW2_CERRI|nr:hypothetical protein KP509_20G007700 [Ceratopteris richardii]KAH7330907.1 hypothetical protein KP509_20G007700 [Ceratopteris richardii]